MNTPDEKESTKDNMLNNFGDMASKNKQEASEPKKLIMDSKTGELLMKKEATTNNDIVVDQIYRDGFFNR